MDIQFYHLLATTLERALPQLVQKALQADYRLQITCRDTSIMKMVDERLWDYDPDSFLPHGTEKEPEAHRQPILLSVSGENLNHANLLLITDGRPLPEEGQESGFARVLDVFNGHDESAVQAARQRWKDYKEAGHTMAYIRQMPDGSWQKQA